MSWPRRPRDKLKPSAVLMTSLRTAGSSECGALRNLKRLRLREIKYRCIFNLEEPSDFWRIFLKFSACRYVDIIRVFLCSKLYLLKFFSYYQVVLLLSISSYYKDNLQYVLLA